MYNFQDVSSWKDLGPKFVLTVLRDFTATKSVEFVRDVFPTVYEQEEHKRDERQK